MILLSLLVALVGLVLFCAVEGKLSTVGLVLLAVGALAALITLGPYKVG